MPGHKEDTGGFLGEVLKYDITEIDGFDDLHEASGIIKESEHYAAKLYGSEETHFLVNGSTVGILSSVLAVTAPGDEILIARNCHKSVYNAVMVNRLKCRYLYPDMIKEYSIAGVIEPDVFREALKKHPGVKTAIITSPTYEGIASDVKTLADIAHERGVILIVDAAHGAHFGFHEGFPESAVRAGADIVINSVHKTLPAPTQTALLHINGPLVNRDAVRRMLKIYQSSSPSYLLMAGIDNCMSIVSEKGRELFREYIENIEWFEKRAEKLKKLKYLSRAKFFEECGVRSADPCKIVISAAGSGITGRQLYEELNTVYHIQPEMAAGDYCLLIMTVMDKREDFVRVISALECTDERLSDKEGAEKIKEESINIYNERPEQVMQAYEAVGADGNETELKDAAGKISADHIMIYPPGIPVIVPGERISDTMIRGIYRAQAMGLKVNGVTTEGKIRIYG